MNLSSYVPKANVDHTIFGQGTAIITLDYSATTPRAIWLFPCLVVLRVSVFYIANQLLFVWTCVRNHNLAACQFRDILYNWYISVIYLDI